MKECKVLVEQIADIIGERLGFAYDLANKIIDCLVYSVNELETTKKALELYIGWADECGIGYDDLGDLYEEYKEKIEAEDMGYYDCLIFITMGEAKKALSEER